MESVIFVKHSYESDPRFRVMTRIVSLENGDREVQKIAVSSASTQHVAEICEAYRILKQCYRKDALSIIPCNMRGEVAVFPYVSGELLTDRIYDLIRLHDTDALVALLQEYVRRITASADLKPFRKTERFSRIFGDSFELDDVPAFQPCDVDMIPSNIIVSGDTWHLFDYEWTFDFPIPVGYIVYRAILYCMIHFNITDVLPEAQLYEGMGLDLSQKNIYEAMEKAFQAYVYGQAVDYASFYDSLRKPIVSLFDIDISNEMLSDGNAIRSRIDALSLADARQKDAIARLNAEGDALRIKLDEMSLAQAQKDDALARLNAEGDALRKQVDEMSLAQAQKDDALVRLNAEGDALRKQVDEMSLAQAQKDDAIARLNAEGDALRKQVDEMSLAQAQKDEAIARMNAEGDALRIKLDEITLAEARQSDAIKRLNAEGDELRLSVDQYIRNEKELRRNNDMLREEADDIRRKYDLLVSMYEDVREKKEEMERHWVWKLVHPFH